MELLDRYLKAVKFWLPSEQKQDIVAELSEDIRSQIEDKESELGRQLNDAEVEAILKKGGPPMLVAQRYLPQRYLIGPALFPTYWMVLKLTWLCFYGPWLVIVVGLKIFASFGAAHAGAAATGMFEPFFRSLVYPIRGGLRSFCADRAQPCQRRIPEELESAQTAQGTRSEPRPAQLFD